MPEIYEVYRDYFDADKVIHCQTSGMNNLGTNLDTFKLSLNYTSRQLVLCMYHLGKHLGNYQDSLNIGIGLCGL